ncbi:MAG: hypothetical protein AAGJ46_14470 [Planctomycetota bacterium]
MRRRRCCVSGEFDFLGAPFGLQTDQTELFDELKTGEHIVRVPSDRRFTTDAPATFDQWKIDVDPIDPAESPGNNFYFAVTEISGSFAATAVVFATPSGEDAGSQVGTRLTAQVSTFGVTHSLVQASFGNHPVASNPDYKEYKHSAGFATQAEVDSAFGGTAGGLSHWLKTGGVIEDLSDNTFYPFTIFEVSCGSAAFGSRVSTSTNLQIYITERFSFSVTPSVGSWSIPVAYRSEGNWDRFFSYSDFVYSGGKLHGLLGAGADGLTPGQQVTWELGSAGLTMHTSGKDDSEMDTSLLWKQPQPIYSAPYYASKSQFSIPATETSPGFVAASPDEAGILLHNISMKAEDNGQGIRVVVQDSIALTTLAEPVYRRFEGSAFVLYDNAYPYADSSSEETGAASWSNRTEAPVAGVAPISPGSEAGYCHNEAKPCRLAISDGEYAIGVRIANLSADLSADPGPVDDPFETIGSIVNNGTFLVRPWERGTGQWDQATLNPQQENGPWGGCAVSSATIEYVMGPLQDNRVIGVSLGVSVIDGESGEVESLPIAFDSKNGRSVAICVPGQASFQVEEDRNHYNWRHWDYYEGTLPPITFVNTVGAPIVEIAWEDNPDYVPGFNNRCVPSEPIPAHDSSLVVNSPITADGSPPSCSLTVREYANFDPSPNPQRGHHARDLPFQGEYFFPDFANGGELTLTQQWQYEYDQVRTGLERINRSMLFQGSLVQNNVRLTDFEHWSDNPRHNATLDLGGSLQWAAILNFPQRRYQDFYYVKTDGTLVEEYGRDGVRTEVDLHLGAKGPYKGSRNFLVDGFRYTWGVSRGNPPVNFNDTGDISTSYTQVKESSRELEVPYVHAAENWLETHTILGYPTYVRVGPSNKYVLTGEAAGLALPRGAIGFDSDGTAVRRHQAGTGTPASGLRWGPNHRFAFGFTAAGLQHDYNKTVVSAKLIIELEEGQDPTGWTASSISVSSNTAGNPAVTTANQFTYHDTGSTFTAGPVAAAVDTEKRKLSFDITGPMTSWSASHVSTHDFSILVNTATGADGEPELEFRGRIHVVIKYTEGSGSAGLPDLTSGSFVELRTFGQSATIFDWRRYTVGGECQINYRFVHTGTEAFAIDSGHARKTYQPVTIEPNVFFAEAFSHSPTSILDGFNWTLSNDLDPSAVVTEFEDATLMQRSTFSNNWGLLPGEDALSPAVSAFEAKPDEVDDLAWQPA